MIGARLEKYGYLAKGRCVNVLIAGGLVDVYIYIYMCVCTWRVSWCNPGGYLMSHNVRVLGVLIGICFAM